MPQKLNFFFQILLFLLLTNCDVSKKINIVDLNGYWKIDFVSKQNEIFRLKGGSFLLDYYYTDGNFGWRKKVAPSINDIFETSNDTTFFKIKSNDKNSFLFFKTKWHNWNEMIVKVDSVSLILKIKDKKYHYKKFSP
tara:strand:- start:16523 stop:16933 length:411 start_codon:yes stop_codon:yes gene_type:complete